MNERVITAAIEAMQAELGDDLGWKPEGWRRVAESAIDAAMLALAPDILTAVDRLETTVAASVAAPSSGRREARDAARCDLLALLGITEWGDE